MEKVGIIGYGNMGKAIAERIKGKYTVSAFDKDKNKISSLKNIIASDNVIDLVEKSKVVILAVKPQDFENVLSEIKAYAVNKLIISIAAGISTRYIERILGRVRVIRTMMNLPVIKGEGMICISKGKYGKEVDLKFVKKLFSSLGKIMVLNENKIDKFTASVGSGPGYFYRLIALEGIDPKNIEEITSFGKNKFIPTFITSAENIGFNEKQAKVFASTTTAGSIALLKDSSLSPRELERKVRSKKGTTEAGLKKLKGLNYLKDAFKAALRRAKKLSKKE